MNKNIFPKDFLWGGFISENQLENTYLNCENLFSKSPLKRNEEKCAPIIENQLLLKEIALFEEMGFKTLKVSISWSKLFPKGNEELPNKQGLKFYDDLFDEMHKYGIEPFVTISHYEIPSELIKKYGGWENRKVLVYFERYLKIIFERYSSKVKYWITFNEFNVSVMSPFIGLGTIVSTESNQKRAMYQAIHHQLVANSLAIKLCRESNPSAKIGAMLAGMLFYPYTCNPDDIFSSLEKERQSYFLSDVQSRGYYPTYMNRFFKENNIEIEMEVGDKEILKIYTVDFISFCYYSSFVVTSESSDKSIHIGLKNPYLETSKWGFQRDSIGLRTYSNLLYDRYQKPLLIIENGVGAADVLVHNEISIAIKDIYKINYSRDNLIQMEEAIKDGVNIMGYSTCWTLDSINSEIKENKNISIYKKSESSGILKNESNKSFNWYKKVIETNGNFI